MRYYLDTEFDETSDRLTLISLALRAEDGRELYLISSDFSTATCSPWVRENVLPHLHAVPANHVGTRDGLHEHIERFCHDGSPEFWGYYCAYDWFLFCRLWGGMLNMPKRFPKVCYDLKQLADTLLPGVRFKDENPPEVPAHNAMADARWNNQLFRWIVSKAGHQAERDDNHTPELRRGVDVFIGDARYGRSIPTSASGRRPARAGDHYKFTYPNEPQFDKTLLVVHVRGDGPEDLVIFEDQSHSKQKNLGEPGAERVST